MLESSSFSSCNPKHVGRCGNPSHEKKVITHIVFCPYSSSYEYMSPSLQTSQPKLGKFGCHIKSGFTDVHQMHDEGPIWLGICVCVCVIAVKSCITMQQVWNFLRKTCLIKPAIIPVAEIFKSRSAKLKQLHKITPILIAKIQVYTRPQRNCRCLLSPRLNLELLSRIQTSELFRISRESLKHTLSQFLVENK